MTAENAGSAAHEVLRMHVLPASGRVSVMCGTGENGGDGLVLARRLHAAGVPVRVLVVGDPEGFHDLARDHYRTATQCGVPCVPVSDREEFERRIHGSGAIVDAIVGTEIDGEASELTAAAIDAINRASRPVLSLDVPSGVCPDTGRVRGAAVRADWTVAFGAPKRGTVVPPGSSHAGKLYVSHLTYPPDLQGAMEGEAAIVHPAPLPPRSPHGHKGSFGDTLFIAGAASYFGAPAFASLASLRAGAGYARLACPKSLAPTLATLAPEVVFVPQAETDEGTLAAGNHDGLVQWARQVDFVVMGPGLSLHAETQQLVRRLVPDIHAPLLLDGDGLTAIAGHADLLRERAAVTVLTPHPGEMARLIEVSPRQVVGDPIESAMAGADRYGAIVVLKGARSIVAHPGRQATINTTGNDGMGTAGSGDVLTGTIAAVAGLGLPVEEAVATGVFLHGLAGDLAMAHRGADGMTARDILDGLPEALDAYRNRYEEIVRDHRGAVAVV